MDPGPASGEGGGALEELAQLGVGGQGRAAAGGRLVVAERLFHWSEAAASGGAAVRLDVAAAAAGAAAADLLAAANARVHGTFLAVSFEIVALGHYGYPEGEPATITVTVTPVPLPPPPPPPPPPTVDAGPDERWGGRPRGAVRIGIVPGCPDAALDRARRVHGGRRRLGVHDRHLRRPGHRSGSPRGPRRRAGRRQGRGGPGHRQRRPTVAITEPVAGTVVAVGQDVTLRATAGDVAADPVTVTLDAGDGSTPTTGLTRTHRCRWRAPTS